MCFDVYHLSFLAATATAQSFRAWGLDDCEDRGRIASETERKRGGDLRHCRSLLAREIDPLLVCLSFALGLKSAHLVAMFTVYYMTAAWTEIVIFDESTRPKLQYHVWCLNSPFNCMTQRGLLYYGCVEDHQRLWEIWQFTIYVLWMVFSVSFQQLWLPSVAHVALLQQIWAFGWHQW